MDIAHRAFNPDRDGDGISDQRDRCPDKPETVNYFEDDDGCPDESPVKVLARHIALTPAIAYTFGGPNSVRLRSRRQLAVLARVLKARPELELLEIGVHTDSQGAWRFNLVLSSKRANAIRARLITLGVAAKRLVARGYGESSPLCKRHHLAECRRKNRRTEFVILKRRPHARPR